MAEIREATDEELQLAEARPEGVTIREATQDELQGVQAPRQQQQPGIVSRALGTAEEAARQFNIGLLEPLGLRSLAQRIGVARPAEGDDESSLVDSALRMTGTAAGMGGAMLAPGLRAMAGAPSAAREVASRAPGLGPAFQQFSQRAAETAARRPGSFWSLELGAAASAGAAGEATSRVTDSPTARLIAETLAGAGVAAAPAAVSGVARYAPSINLARNAINAFRAPSAPTRATRQRAAERLGRAVPDARDMFRRASEADVLEDAPLSLAELSNEPRLMSLQRSVADATEELSQANQQRFADINEITQRALRTLTETEAAGRIDPQETRRYLETLMDERIRIARAAVDERLQRLGPNVDRETANRLARQELDKAYAEVRGQEAELWEAVDLRGRVGTTNTQEAYKALLTDSMRNRVTTPSRFVPARVREFFGEIDPETGELTGGRFLEGYPKAAEIRDLRGELNDMATRERAKPAPNRRRLRALAQLQESMLEDLSSIPGSEKLDAARAFSRDLNERFRQGEVGDLLGFDIEGGASRPALLTLESTLGRANMRAAEVTDQIMKAVNMAQRDPQMKQHMESFLTDEFLRTAKKGGAIDTRAAARYLQRRQDVLRRFPELRQRLVQATESGEALVAAEAMRDPKQSAAALVIGASPGNEMDRLIGQTNPREGARELMTILDEDITGRAKQGMRSAIADWVLERSTSRFQADVSDRAFLSGRRMRELLEDPSVKQVIDEVMTPEQRDRLRKISNTATALDISRRSEASPEGIIGDREALLVGMLRRFGAAATGRAAGRAAGAGGTVQIPGQFVQLSEQLVNRGLDPARKLIMDAVMSPDDALMRTLLMETPLTARRQELANQTLQAWSAAVAADLGMELQEDPPQE